MDSTTESHHRRGPGRRQRGALCQDQPASGPADFTVLCSAFRLEHGEKHPYLRAMPDLRVVSADDERFPALRSVVSLLDDDASQPQTGSSVPRLAILDLMVAHVLCQWAEDDSAKGRTAAPDPAITAVLHTIHDNPQRPWTAAQLGATVGMSRTVFTRRFTSVVGTPPMTYLRNWRLRIAARLLRETDASLAAIARRIGYSTEFAFAGAFRREYGVSPGRFRHGEHGPA